MKPRNNLAGIKVGLAVYVEWEDCKGCGRGWDDIENLIEEEITLGVSLGWIINIAPSFITLAPTMNADGLSAMGVSTIPKSAIRKLRLLGGVPHQLPKTE